MFQLFLVNISVMYLYMLHTDYVEHFRVLHNPSIFYILYFAINKITSFYPFLFLALLSYEILIFAFIVCFFGKLYHCVFLFCLLCQVIDDSMVSSMLYEYVTAVSLGRFIFSYFILIRFVMLGDCMLLPTHTSITYPE